MIKSLFVIAVFVLLLSACKITEKSAKQELNDGFYTKKTSTKKQKVYLNVTNDSILMYPVSKQNKSITVDTLHPFTLHLTEVKPKEKLNFKLSKSSFDIDFITIPAKFRFPINNVAPQLNSELNGSVYFGYRKDAYHIKHKTNSLNILGRKTTHFGYSIGLFTGIGNTFMSPTTTNDKLQQEYDGIIWSKGIAAIIGLNKISLGVALGYDNLLDENNTIWIYENKPWIGLALGLNLN